MSRAARTPYEEDLSDRELDVLRPLATDLTQREIGERSTSRSTQSRPM